MAYWNQRTVATARDLHGRGPPLRQARHAHAGSGPGRRGHHVRAHGPGRRDPGPRAARRGHDPLHQPRHRQGPRRHGRARARRASRASASTTAASRWTAPRSPSSTARPRPSSCLIQEAGVADASRRQALPGHREAGRDPRRRQARPARAGRRRSSIDFTADFDHPLITNQALPRRPHRPHLRARGGAGPHLLLPARHRADAGGGARQGRQPRERHRGGRVLHPEPRGAALPRRVRAPQGARRRRRPVAPAACRWSARSWPARAATP